MAYSTIYQGNYTQLDTGTTVGAGVALNLAPLLTNTSPNIAQVVKHGGANTGRLEIVPQGSINQFLANVTMTDRGTGEKANQRVTARVDLQETQRWVGVMLRTRRSQSNPTNAHFAAVICRSEADPTSVYLHCGFSTQDPSVILYAGEPGEWTLPPPTRLDAAELGGYDAFAAKGIHLQVEAANTNPTTLTVRLYAASATVTDDTLGALLYEFTGTAGNGTGQVQDPNLAYLDDVGAAAPGNSKCEIAVVSSNFGINTEGATAPSNGRIMALKMETDVAGGGAPPLAAAAPTITSRAVGSNVLASSVSGGTAPYTRQWHRVADPTDALDATNDIVGATAATLTDAVTPTVYSPHGEAIAADLLWYGVVAADAAAGADTSDLTLVPNAFTVPALPAAHRDIVTDGRKVILAFAGDSITAVPEIRQAVLTTLTGTFLIPAAQLITTDAGGVPASGYAGGVPGSKLLDEWQVALGVRKTVVDAAEAKLALNPGALVVVPIMLGINDFQNYNNGALEPTTAQLLAAMDALCDYIQVTRNHPDWAVVVNFMGWYQTLNTSFDVDMVRANAMRNFRAALLAHTGAGKFQGETNNRYLGDFDYQIDSYLDRSLMADEVHDSATGNTQHGLRWAQALVRGPLRDVDTVAPTILSAVLGTDGLTLTLTLDETTTGTAGFTVTVNGVTRAVTWVRTSGTVLTGTLASVAYLGAALTYSYVQAGGNILDTAGNELAAITNASVTNNSTQTAGGGGGGTGTVNYLIASGRGNLRVETQPLTEGDTSGTMAVWLRDADGRPVPIGSGSTVLFRLRLPGASSAAVGGVAEILDGSEGKVGFAFSEDTPVPPAGYYEATFQVDGLTFPVVTHGNRIPVRVREAL